MNAPPGFDVICFPIIDWGFRFQRPQQLLTCFARDGHRVFYLATGFGGLDRQGAEIGPLGSGIFGVALPGEADVDIYSTRLEGETLDQASDALEGLIAQRDVRDAVLLVQYPSWEPLVRILQRRHGWRVVYDCMDAHEGFGTHGPTTLEDETELVRHADLVVVTSKPLLRKFARMGLEAALIPNGVDYERFSRLPPREASSLAHLARPVVGYYGAIAGWFDVEAVRCAAEARPAWSFVLIGSTKGSDLGALSGCANVHLVGEKPHEEIPACLAAFDVCTIPFLRTSLTEATNPVKLYEYLAAGKPVVARALPELEPLRDVIRLYDHPGEFPHVLEAALSDDDPGLAGRRRELARESTWQARYRALASRIEEIDQRPQRRPVPAATTLGEKDRRPGLDSILAEHRGARAIVVVLPAASGDGSLSERPEELARALSRLGCLVLLWRSPSPASPGGIAALEPSLYIADVPLQAFEELDSPVVVTYALDARLLRGFRSPRVAYEYLGQLDCLPGSRAELRDAHEAVLDLADVVTVPSGRAFHAAEAGSDAIVLSPDAGAEAAATRILEALEAAAQARPDRQLLRRDRRLQRLQDGLASRKREIHRLVAQVQVHAEGVAWLKQEVAGLEQEVAARDRVVEAREQELRTRERELEALKEELRTREQQLRTRERELEALKEELRTREQQLRGREKELEGIYQSRLWKAGQAYRRTLHALRRVARLACLPLVLGIRALRLAIPKDVRIRLRSLRKPDPPLTPTEAAVMGGQIPLPAPGAVPAFRPGRSGRHDVVCFSIIDWDFRWQRPQQILSQFADHGHRVFFFSTTKFLGTRGKRYKLRPLRENVWEVLLAVPRPVDVYSGELPPDIAAWIADDLAILRDEFRIACAVSYVQVATWAPAACLARERFGWRIAYDCMDEWDTFPGMREALLDEELRLVRDADLLIVSGRKLWEKWSGLNSNMVLARNAADFRRFQDPPRSELLADVRGPVVGYFGAIAEWFDVELVTRLARQRPQYTFVLLGGVFHKAPVGELKALPNVRLLGQKPYELMPAYLERFDACLIPFRVNSITEATDPVKFYEYVSQGKPVVASRMPELAPYANLLYIAENEDDFIRKVDLAVTESDPEVRARRIALARENTWEARYELIQGGIRNAHPRASIIIVSYFNLEYTRLCLESVLSNTVHPNYEVVVVDNGSTDGTPEYLAALQETHSHVAVILNDGNLGFARANNQGLAIATGERLVLLNNDTVVPYGWLTKLIRHLDRPEVGLVVSVTNFSGNESRIAAPYRDLDEMEGFAWRYTREHEGEPFDIRVAAMYCVALRRDAFEKVGPLDERFSVGMFEDDDYSHRMRLAGYRVVCAEDAFVHHFGQASFKKLSPDEYQAIWDRNQRLYEEKWGMAWTPHTARR